MVGNADIRRSGRERKTVKTLIDEQNEEVVAPPAKRQNRQKAKSTATKAIDHPPDKLQVPAEEPFIHPVLELSSDEDFEAPKKKRAKEGKQPKLPGKVDEYGVRRLDTVELRPPGEKRPAQIWEVPKKSADSKGAKAPPLAAIMAETFEDRYQRQVSNIRRLAPGQEETRLKTCVKFCLPRRPH